jgi:hypothetical protein
MTIDVPIVRPPRVYCLQIWSPATLSWDPKGLRILQENEETAWCGVEVVHVIQSVAVVFEDLLEFLSICPRKRTNVIELSSIVPTLQAVQELSFWQHLPNFGLREKKSHCGV